MDPAQLPTQSPNVTYLKELWHAIQTQEITGQGALLALTQRPLTTPDAPGGPPPNLPVGPAEAAPRRACAGSGASARLGRSDPFVGTVGEELVLPHR